MQSALPRFCGFEPFFFHCFFERAGFVHGCGDSRSANVAAPQQSEKTKKEGEREERPFFSLFRTRRNVLVCVRNEEKKFKQSQTKTNNKKLAAVYCACFRCSLHQTKKKTEKKAMPKEVLLFTSFALCLARFKSNHAHEMHLQFMKTAFCLLKSNAHGNIGM